MQGFQTELLHQRSKTMVCSLDQILGKYSMQTRLFTVSEASFSLSSSQWDSRNRISNTHTYRLDHNERRLDKVELYLDNQAYTRRLLVDFKSKKCIVLDYIKKAELLKREIITLLILMLLTT